MATYTFKFEGQIEFEADSKDEAIEKAFRIVTVADVGWWEVQESDHDHAKVTTQADHVLTTHYGN